MAFGFVRFFPVYYVHIFVTSGRFLIFLVMLRAHCGATSVASTVLLLHHLYLSSGCMCRHSRSCLVGNLQTTVTDWTSRTNDVPACAPLTTNEAERARTIACMWFVVLFLAFSFSGGALHETAGFLDIGFCVVGFGFMAHYYGSTHTPTMLAGQTSWLSSPSGV